MTEPEERELVDWFWWTSCKLFSELGRYANEMSVLGIRDDSSSLAPLQFTQNGEPKQEDLIKHFKICGVRIQDANEHLLDFSKIYLTRVNPPTAPNWSGIPPSRPRVSQPSINKCRKRGNKAFTDRDLPTPGYSRRQLIDRLDDGSPPSHHTSLPPTNTKGLPSGSPREFPSESQTGNSQPPTNESHMHVE